MAFYHWIPDIDDFISFFKGKWFFIYFIALVVVLGGTLHYGKGYLGRVPLERTEKELAIKADLENELDSLQIFPNTAYNRIHSYGGRDNHDSWTVSTDFETPQSFASVYQHYSTQLKTHGWQEISVLEQSARYRKNIYEAVISKSDKPNTNYITLSWHKSTEHPPSNAETLIQVAFLILFCGFAIVFISLSFVKFIKTHSK